MHVRINVLQLYWCIGHNFAGYVVQRSSAQYIVRMYVHNLSIVHPLGRGVIVQGSGHTHTLPRLQDKQLTTQGCRLGPPCTIFFFHLNMKYGEQHVLYP